MGKATVALTFVLVCAFALVCVRVLKWAGVPEGVEFFGSLVVGGTREVHKFVAGFAQRFSRDGGRARAESLARLEEFTLPWYLMLAYGASLYIVALQAAGGLAGLLAGSDEDLVGLTQLAAVLVAVFVLYLLGTWIGARVDRLSVLVLYGIVVIGQIVGVALTWVAIDEQHFEKLFDTEKTIGTAVLFLLGGTVVFAVLATIFGLVGIWWGRRTQLSRYARFVLKKFPPDVQRSVIDRWYEEALRVTAERASPPPAEPPTVAAS